MLVVVLCVVIAVSQLGPWVYPYQSQFKSYLHLAEKSRLINPNFRRIFLYELWERQSFFVLESSKMYKVVQNT